MKKLITIAVFDACLALAGCGAANENSPQAGSPASPVGGTHSAPQGEIPLGAPTGAPPSGSSAFDDRTWNVGDCVNTGDPANRIGYFKVPCNSSRAQFRIMVKITDISLNASEVCRSKLASDPVFNSTTGGEVLSAGYYNFCLDSVKADLSLQAQQGGDLYLNSNGLHGGHSFAIQMGVAREWLAPEKDARPSR